jgi:hypothetical protein
MTNHTHEAAATQFVEADGVRLNYRRFGKNERVRWFFSLVGINAVSVEGFERAPAMIKGDSRTFFEQFVANANDAEAVALILRDSPDFLRVSRGTQVRGTKQRWSSFAATRRAHRI